MTDHKWLVVFHVGSLIVTISALVAVVFLLLAPPARAYMREAGDWGDWWSMNTKGDASFNSGMGAVRRIYDQENKLVCWVYKGSTWDAGGGISCVPSLELGHPMAQ